MYAFLLSALVAAAPFEDKPAAAADSLDGNWTVLCFEKDGQPMPNDKDHTVTIKGDTVTCTSKDGKKAMVMRVEFGPKGTVKVADATNAAPGDKPEYKEGVYIHTHDFLAVCVHKTGERPVATTSGKPEAKYSCVVFLKREGAK